MNDDGEKKTGRHHRQSAREAARRARSRAASSSSISPSPPSDGGEGWGEEVRFYWFPLSSFLSPLVPRGERMESLMQPRKRSRWQRTCLTSLLEHATRRAGVSLWLDLRITSGEGHWASASCWGCSTA